MAKSKIILSPLYTANGKASLPIATQEDIDNKFVGCMRGVESGCYLAGDARANEQIGLTIIHIIWMREHNRVAGILKANNPSWTADRVFRTARSIIAGEMQKITYKEYLPTVFGQNLYNKLIGDYSGYDPDVDAAITNNFATAAFRFGHSQVRPTLEKFDENYKSIGHLQLVDAFFNPVQYELNGGTDSILRGMVATPARLVDEFLNEDLTRRLFETDTQSGMDLATLNMQRGRDHGLPPYTVWKRWAARNDTCSLTTGSRLSFGFANIVTVIQFLKLYGSLDTVDLWLGGLAEATVPGAIIGPTFACILGEGFKNLRDGDRFYYENVKEDHLDALFTAEQRDEIEKASLSRIICDNADNIQEIQPNAFLLEPREQCSSLPQVDLSAWTTSLVMEDDLVHTLEEAVAQKNQMVDMQSSNSETEELIKYLEELIDKLEG